MSGDGIPYRLDLVDDAGEVVDSVETNELGFRMAMLADRDPSLIPALEMIVERPEGVRVLLDRLGVSL